MYLNEKYYLKIYGGLMVGPFNKNNYVDVNTMIRSFYWVTYRELNTCNHYYVNTYFVKSCLSHDWPSYPFYLAKAMYSYKGCKQTLKGHLNEKTSNKIRQYDFNLEI